jgi:hypothetical protein
MRLLELLHVKMDGKIFEKMLESGFLAGDRKTGHVVVKSWWPSID